MINLFILSLYTILHPFYISVTSIEHNPDKQLVEISCRIFFDDLEKALDQEHRDHISLLKPADKAKVDQYLDEYLRKNLEIQLDGAPAALHYLGYEIQEDAAWCYLEIPSITQVKQIRIRNTILYSSHEKESNIIHAKANGQQKSIKLDNPTSGAFFTF